MVNHHNYTIYKSYKNVSSFYRDIVITLCFIVHLECIKGWCECTIKICSVASVVTVVVCLFTVWLLPDVSLVSEEDMPEPVTGCLLEILRVLHWQQRPRSHCAEWDAKMSNSRIKHKPDILWWWLSNNQASCLKTVTVLFFQCSDVFHSNSTTCTMFLDLG